MPNNRLTQGLTVNTMHTTALAVCITYVFLLILRRQQKSNL